MTAATSLTGVAAPRARRSGLLPAAVLCLLPVVLTLGGPWLPVLLPAVGVVLAEAARRSAGDYDAAGSPRAFLGRRLPRLLLTCLLFVAATVATATWLRGWQPSWVQGHVWLWAVPVAEPPLPTPAPGWRVLVWTAPLYLWFVLLTPWTLWLFRRWPVRLTLVPLTLLGLMALGLLDLHGRPAEVLLALCVYAPCWLAGMAAHLGSLRRLRLGEALVVSAAVVAPAVWTVLHRTGELTLSAVPIPVMLVAAGLALLVLRLSPEPGVRRPGRARRALTALPRFLADRPLTCLLACGPAVAATPAVLDRMFSADLAGGPWVRTAVSVGLLLALAAAVGLLEAPLVRTRTRPVADEVPSAEPGSRTYVLRDNVVQNLPADGTGLRDERETRGTAT
jgi:hypothetical protein